MNFAQGFRMAAKSISSNKVRSFLTMLGIMIGIAAVLILVSVVEGSNQITKEYYESMGTNKINVYAYNYNGEDVTQPLYDYCLSLDDLVIGVTPNGYTWGDIRYKTTSTASNQDYWGAEIYLGSEQYSLCNNYTLAEGRDISYLDVQSYNKVAVIGSKLKDYLFQYRDPIGEKITIGSNTFEVVGVYEQRGTDDMWYYDYMCVLPYTMNRLMNNSNTINEFVVKAKSSAATKEAVIKLQDFLAKKIDPMYGHSNVYTADEWIEESNDQNAMMSRVLGGIAGISLLVGGIGIMNIMLVTVRERTREIGIRKAIGGSRKSILTQFLIEASVVCALGGIIGIILGYLGSVIAGKLMLDQLVFPSMSMTIFAFALSVGLGIGFGMYPAAKASNLQPVEALRAD